MAATHKKNDQKKKKPECFQWEELKSEVHYLFWLYIITILDTFMASLKINELYTLMIQTTSMFSLTSFLLPSPP